EQPVNAVAVVLVILGRVDAALRCDRMRASWRILKTKAFYVVSELTEGRRGRSAGETGAHHNDLKLPPVVGAYQSSMVPVISPFLCQRSRRNLWIKCSDHALKYLRPSRNVILSEAKNLGPDLERFINRNIQRCFAVLNMTAPG